MSSTPSPLYRRRQEDGHLPFYLKERRLPSTSKGGGWSSPSHLQAWRMSSTSQEGGWPPTEWREDGHLPQKGNHAWSSAICSKGKWVTTFHPLQEKGKSFIEKARGCHPSEREEDAIYFQWKQHGHPPYFSQPTWKEDVIYFKRAEDGHLCHPFSMEWESCHLPCIQRSRMSST